MAFKTGKINMDQLKINLQQFAATSYLPIRLLSPIVRDSLVLRATRFIPMIQSKHEYQEKTN